MNTGAWVEELPAEVLVCDQSGLVLEMNSGAEALFSEDGGRRLIGSNILACHPQSSIDKLSGILERMTANCYLNTENGEKRFFFQSPWFCEGCYAGFVEISFAVPQNIPHFIRE
jgi:hypothetical protein